MSINDIQLPEFIIGEWYKDSLLPPPGGRIPPAAPAIPPLPPATPATTAAPAIPPLPPAAPATTAAPAPAASAATASPYKVLGDNRRKITLLVHAPGSPFLPDDQLTFLTKILEACHMTLADVAIVNNAGAQVTITALRRQLQPAKMILFGPEPTDIRLPINFPHFKPISYDDCTYLSAPAPDLLAPNTGESKLLKSKLWVCLKTLFDL